MVIRGVEQTPLLGKSVENAGTGNGAQEVDAGHVDTGLFDESFKLGRQFKGIFVEAVNETAVDTDTSFPNVFYALHLAIGGVVKLLVGVVAAVIKAFDTDQKRATT